MENEVKPTKQKIIKIAAGSNRFIGGVGLFQLVVRYHPRYAGSNLFCYQAQCFQATCHACPAAGQGWKHLF